MSDKVMPNELFYYMDSDIMCHILRKINYFSESPYFSRRKIVEQDSHNRRSSEKVKRKMKMADLKAFVETKLLSKSEKTLEKIGRDETKSLFEQVTKHC